VVPLHGTPVAVNLTGRSAAVLHASLGQCPALFKSCALLDLEAINVQNYLGVKI
jgi:hypothetical protein